MEQDEVTLGFKTSTGGRTLIADLDIAFKRSRRVDLRHVNDVDVDTPDTYGGDCKTKPTTPLGEAAQTTRSIRSTKFMVFTFILSLCICCVVANVVVFA